MSAASSPAPGRLTPIRLLGWIAVVAMLALSLLAPAGAMAGGGGLHQIAPTASPTDSAPPTEAPTEMPTDSVLPTATATGLPTEAPTEAPTDVPSEAPTEVPTESPSVVPSESASASATGSSLPTATTTTVPSGSVGGVTGAPELTPPSTDTQPGTGRSVSGDDWRILVLALAGILSLVLALTPAPRRAEIRVRHRDR